MPDKYGNPLRAGDRVLFTTITYGSLEQGVMKYDEDEKAKLHIEVEYEHWQGGTRTTTKHINRYKGDNSTIINVAAYVKMQLEEGIDLSDA